MRVTLIIPDETDCIFINMIKTDYHAAMKCDTDHNKIAQQHEMLTFHLGTELLVDGNILDFEESIKTKINTSS